MLLIMVVSVISTRLGSLTPRNDKKRVSGVLSTCPWDCNHPLHVHEYIFFLECYLLFLFGVSGVFWRIKLQYIYTYYESPLLSVLRFPFFKYEPISANVYFHHSPFGILNICMKLRLSSSKPFLVEKACLLREVYFLDFGWGFTKTTSSFKIILEFRALLSGESSVLVCLSLYWEVLKYTSTLWRNTSMFPMLDIPFVPFMNPQKLWIPPKMPNHFYRFQTIFWV